LRRELPSAGALIYDSAEPARARRGNSIANTAADHKTATCSIKLFGGTVAKKIVIKNPWSGEMVERDISGLTPAELESYPLDEGICDEIARAIAPCLPEEFLAAYVKRVGAITGGIAIFGAQLVRRGLSDSDDGSMSPA
jgi:hypothetical protein